MANWTQMDSLFSKDSWQKNSDSGTIEGEMSQIKSTNDKGLWNHWKPMELKNQQLNQSMRYMKISKVQSWLDIRIWGSHLLAIVWSWSYFWLSHHALCLSRFWIKSRRKFKETISKSVSLQPQISWTSFAMFSLYLLECSLHISKEYQRKFKENVSSVPACNLIFLEQCWMQSAQFWEPCRQPGDAWKFDAENLHGLKMADLLYARIRHYNKRNTPRSHALFMLHSHL